MLYSDLVKYYVLLSFIAAPNQRSGLIFSAKRK